MATRVSLSVGLYIQQIDFTPSEYLEGKLIIVWLECLAELLQYSLAILPFHLTSSHQPPVIYGSQYNTPNSPNVNGKFNILKFYTPRGGIATNGVYTLI